MSPVVPGSAWRDVQQPGGFLHSQAGKISQLYQLCLSWVLDCELFERLIHRQKLIVSVWRSEVDQIDIDSLLAPAMAQSLFAASSLDQNAAHRFSRRREEMRAPGKLGVLVARQSQPGFMHQGRGLQGIARRLVGHLGRRQPAQLLVNQRQQFRGCFRVALLGGLKNVGNWANDPNNTPF
jgi:hypothetical protein